MNHFKDFPALQIRASFAPDSVNESALTAELMWTTGAPVVRGGMFSEPYLEELSLDPAHIRMDRINGGAPLLDSHNRESVRDVIGVVERAWIDTVKGEGRATVRFSPRPDVAPIFGDVKAGIIRNVSVGYFVHKMELQEQTDGGMSVYRVTDWTPFELSLVPVGADPEAGVRTATERTNCEIVDLRSEDQGEKMEQVVETKPEPVVATVEQPAVVAVEETPAPEVNVEEVRKVAFADERRRITEIKKAVRAAKLNDEFAEGLIEGGASLERARELMIDELAKKDVKVENHVRAGNQDETQTRREGMAEAILHRAMPSKYAATEKGSDFRNMSLLRMAEEVVGASARRMSNSEIAVRALSTSDFQIILSNVANKSLRDSYALAGKSFQPFVRMGTLRDYKEASRIQLGDAPDLEVMAEDGEYTFGSIGEGAEKIRLVKRGKMIKITEEAIINDDLDALSRIPQMLGQAAGRAESKAVYDVLMANAAMADGVALFHASHGNLGTASTIPNGLDAARAAMRKQKTLDGSDYLELSPKFLVVGPDKEVEALKQITAVIPNATANVNVYASAYQLIVEPRITGNKWFVLCDPSTIDTIELAYLEGMSGPQVTSQPDWKSDGVELKVKHVFGVKAIDHRGMFYNSGL